MKLWRVSRNEVWNELLVSTVIGWRTDCRRVKEYSKLSAYPLSHVATQAYAGVAEISLLQACEPVFQSLERLEQSFEVLKIGFTDYHRHYPYNQRRGTTLNSGGILQCS